MSQHPKPRNVHDSPLHIRWRQVCKRMKNALTRVKDPLTVSAFFSPGNVRRIAPLYDKSPLQKGYVTAETQCSQRKSIVWLRRVLRYASNHVSFLAFSARPASQRCVFAVKSKFIAHPGVTYTFRRARNETPAETHAGCVVDRDRSVPRRLPRTPVHRARRAA